MPLKCMGNLADKTNNKMNYKYLKPSQYTIQTVLNLIAALDTRTQAGYILSPQVIEILVG